MGRVTTRTPDQLAREVAEALEENCGCNDFGNSSRCIYSDQAAALAELQAQAEAGQRLQAAVDRAIAVGELSLPHWDAICRSVAAAAPSPADQRTPTPWDSAEFERNAKAVRRATGKEWGPERMRHDPEPSA